MEERAADLAATTADDPTDLPAPLLTGAPDTEASPPLQEEPLAQLQPSEL